MNADQLMKLWVVEFSKRQGAFHVEEVQDMIRGNIDQFIDNSTGDRDYVVVGFTESHEQSHELVKKLREKRDGGSGEAR